MDYFESKPSPRFQSIVDRYFFLSTSSIDAGYGSECIVPDNTPGLLIMLENYLERIDSSTGIAASLTESYIFGQKSRLIHYKFPGSEMCCIGIKFKPSGLSKIISLPVSDLTNHFVETDCLLKLDVDALRDRISHLTSHEHKFGALENCLGSAIEAVHNPSENWIDHIIQKMVSLGGHVKISALSAEFGTYPKMLERKFLRHTGLTPKTFCRILRFNNSIGIRQRFPDSNYSDIAQRTGYYDQMHYIRDFKEFTGKTPTAFFNSRFGKLSSTLQQSFIQG